MVIMPGIQDNGRLYQELDVDPRASTEDISRAYRRLAHAAHPDTHPEDPDAPRRFRELTAAYEVLSNPQRRASYDRARLPHPPPSASPRPAPAPDAPPAGADPIVVSPVPPVPGGRAPLRVGPVHIEPSTPPTGGPVPRLAADGLARLLAEMADLRRWP